MPMYQRRRPSPIKVFRRQAPTPTGSGAPGAEETNGPESPESPLSSASSAGGLSSPESGEDSDSDDEDEKKDEKEESKEPQSPKSPRPSAAEAQTAIPSGRANSTAPVQQISSASSSTRIVAASQVTDGPSSTKSNAVTTTAPSTFRTSTLPDMTFTNKMASPARPTQSVTSGAVPESMGSDSGAAADRQQPQRTDSRSGMSHQAEAAMITFTILGGLALLLGLFIFIKKRRRSRENTLRHADSAFDPGNTGSLSQPETVHVSNDSHLTRSTNATTSLFGAGRYTRPETVSTDRDNAISRVPPTPNPFVDPPLNKAYDQLRGRPRSTTLTDRGSWEVNPFKDPISDRFDPFGELQEKARMERVKYMEDLRREQAELEQERARLEAGSTPESEKKGNR